MLISAYSTRYDSVPHRFTPVEKHFRWHETGEEDAAFATDLIALEHYVTEVSGQHPSHSGYLLLRHIRDTQSTYTFTMDDSDPDQLAELTDWATKANAILVAEGAIVDPGGRPLLAGPHASPTGQVPLMADSVDRAKTVRHWLASTHKLFAPNDLPPVRGAAETHPRDIADVGLRIIGLTLISDLAGATPDDSRSRDIRQIQATFPRTIAALSPREEALFSSRFSDRKEVRVLRLSVEAANELLWAVQRVTLGWPSQPCDASGIENLVLEDGEQEFLSNLQMRPLSELLDEYECLTSLKWALANRSCDDATTKSEADPDIATRRFAALEWLLKPTVAWDDVNP